MSGDSGVENAVRPRDQENDAERVTPQAGESAIVHDVDALLSCINLWQKERRETAKLGMADRFPNVAMNPFSQDGTPLNDGIKRGMAAFEDFLKHKSLKAGPEDREHREAEADGEGLTLSEKTIISDLNYPIDINYEKYTIAVAHTKDEDLMSDRSSDTRFGTDESEMSSNKLAFFTGAGEEDRVEPANARSAEGKKIDPGFMNEAYQPGAYPESKEGGRRDGNYGHAGYENGALRGEENVEESYVEEFRDTIGEFLNGENYQLEQDMDTQMLKGSMGPGNAVVRRNMGEEAEIAPNGVTLTQNFEEDELENEENPILLMSTREEPVITERDILRYGKSESNLEMLATVPTPIKNGVAKNIDMIRDVSVNCQIDQIMGRKEEPQPAEPEKIRGVCYCKSDNSWTAWWTEKGKSRKKAFKLSLYGYEEARKKAIEHRMYVEELIPELKERKFKSTKRKATAPLVRQTPTHAANEAASAQRAPKDRPKFERLHPSPKDEGIYRGTRNRSRERTDDQGIYFKDNVWNATWMDSQGKRVVSSFPVTKELPFLAARAKSINAYVMNNREGNMSQAVPQFDSNSEGLYQGINPNYGPNLNFRNYDMFKRRKLNLDTQETSRVEGLEYFKNLEKLEEEIERARFNQSQLYAVQKGGQLTSQAAVGPQIYVQSIQEFKLPGTDGAETQASDAALGEDSKLNSLHCQIKLDRAILDEIERAIKKSLEEKEVQSETTQSAESDQTTSEEKEGAEGAARVDGSQQEGEKDQRKLENVNALCISQKTADRQTSINIIPTYVRGPRDTKLLTFVILNS